MSSKHKNKIETTDVLTKCWLHDIANSSSSRVKVIKNNAIWYQISLISLAKQQQSSKKSSNWQSSYTYL